MFGIDRRLIVGSTSRWLKIGIAVGMLGLVASLLLYWFLGQAIDAMVRGENLLLAWGPWVALLLVAKLALGWLYRAAQYRASSLTKLTIRDTMYGHALKLGPAVLDKKRTGELVNIAVDGMDWIELFYGIYSRITSFFTNSDYEAKRFHERVYASQDAIEGPRAFSEKRAPRWIGR